MKKWYQSKTVFVNILAILASTFFPEFLTPERQVQVLVAINLFLRVITKEELTW